MSSADELYCLNVKLCVKPEHREEFLKCIEANRGGTLNNEPLALRYLFGEDQNTPNTFHFWEQYKGKAGFEAHTKAEHFANWEKFAGSDPFTAEPDVRFYTETPYDKKPTQQQDSENNQLFCLNVTLKIKEERREEFLKCIAGNQDGTLTAEPLARAYLFGEDVSTRNTFHFHERYVGQEGFDGHKAASHFAVWEKFAGSDPFTAAPEVMFYVEAP